MRNLQHIFLILSVLSVLSVVSICYANNIVVELDPDNINANMGDEFYLNLNIKNVPSDTKCGGFEVEINYDKSLLNLTNIQLSDIANTANLKDASIEDGKINLAWFSNNPSGDFTIATLSFKSISDGNGTISLNSVSVSDENGIKYTNLTINYANITINTLNQTVGKIVLDNFAYNKYIEAIIHIDGAKTPIYNISGNITFNNVDINGNPTILIPFNTSILTISNSNTMGFFISPKNSSKYIDLLKIPITIPDPNYNITLNLFINGKKITKTFVEIPTTNLSKYVGFTTDDSFGNIVENTNITFGTSKTVRLKVFNVNENITRMTGNIFVNTSVFEIKDYKIPDYSNIRDKVNYSNISLNGNYLFFNISLFNATNDTFSIVEFTIYPNLNKNISSKIYVSNFTLYANKTPIILPTKPLIIQIIERGNNTPPMGKIALSIRNNRAVDFYALSYDPDDEELKYYWDFGDGTNSTRQNPTHNYKNYSDYLVKLTIEDSLNASFTTCCAISLSDYAPLNYTFSRKNFTENEENKTTYLNLSIKNPLNWKTRAYINFEDYGNLNLTKTQYDFELNPNETKILIIPIGIKETSTIKWNLVLYPEIEYRHNNPQLSYYLWNYNEKIEVVPLTTVKVDNFKKDIILNTTDVILNINKNKVPEKYVVNKTIKLNLIEKGDVIYYCLISLIGFIIGIVFIKIIV